MIYYLYHIPGKKIGVTRNIIKRVTQQQGYKEGEYDILEQSEDINYISDREIELQKYYGYKVDDVKYKIKKMYINITEQTSTFPVTLNKLKARLYECIGMTWGNQDYSFKLSKNHISWILSNVQTSKYRNNRCYIYNKPYYEAFYNKKHTPIDIQHKDFDLTNTITKTSFEDIRSWAEARGIYNKGNSHTQYVKLMEEAGELAKALLNRDKAEIVDAIGDITVVLTNLAELEGLKIEDCIDSAYNVISKRKGKMINGTFVKDK
jgi:NTP pyrophosphatase (non-canonical NTP hydrolase)